MTSVKEPLLHKLFFDPPSVVGDNHKRDRHMASAGGGTTTHYRWGNIVKKYQNSKNFKKFNEKLTNGSNSSPPQSRHSYGKKG